ncbi:hypothetical protein [Spirillospora sp. NPDC047279]|uniref:hypothetical protein n=1 Tax=Spirillospora sp. NPDC047279 TaxID=3155478 RepID=UPI0034054D92
MIAYAPILGRTMYGWPTTWSVYQYRPCGSGRRSARSATASSRSRGDIVRGVPAQPLAA